MSIIPEYKLEDIQRFMNLAVKGKDKALAQSLPFEEWKCLAYPTLFKNPDKFNVSLMDYSKPIRVSPTGQELLKIVDAHRKELDEIRTNYPADQQDAQITELFRSIFKPVYEINIKEPVTIPGTLVERGETINMMVPIWFNTTISSVNVRLGFDNLDASTPGAIPLGDKPVHMLLGGTTGSGKSVAINDIICSLLLEYPPWELSLVLADFKIVELSRYANRIPTPHVKLVAATGSTEFALSTFKYLTEEMTARQKIFTAAGVQNLKDFRKKFDLCMPRILLIADEFVQMYENVKVAVEKGSDNADELKSSIGNAISAVARLGRSQGVHMLLSSQNMDGVLDDQTAGQFSAGASLKATGPVSKTLIGNDAGAGIKVKGRAFVNLDKTVPSSTNVQVRVPFIESEAKVVDGKETKTYLLELLETMNSLAEQVNYRSEPFYYNENDTIPRQYFYDALAECKAYMNNPDEGDNIRNEIYKDITFARLPLGKELAYTTQLAYPISLQFKKEHNLLINADDNITKLNIIKLVAEGLSYFANKFVIVSADIVLYRQCNLESIAKKRSLLVDTFTTGTAPEHYLNMVNIRTQLLDLQNIFDTSSNGNWDSTLALEYVYNLLASKYATPLYLIKDSIDKNYSELLNPDVIVDEFVKERMPNLEADNLVFVTTVLSKLVSFYKTFRTMTHNFSERLCSRSFSKIVVWWLGIDNFTNIATADVRGPILNYLSSSCQVGIFNVIIPSLRCDRVSSLCEACNFILEKCNKQFFTDASISPKTININENSYQVFDRSMRSHTIVRLYS